MTTPAKPAPMSITCATGKCRCWCDQTSKKHEGFDSQSDPFRHLLSSNNPPNEDETKSLVQNIEQIEDELDDLGDDIKRVKKILKSLKSTRSVKKQRLRAYENALSPIRRLPFEILARVFSFSGLPSKWPCRGDEMASSLNRDDAPWTLLGVCSKWREIALDTPETWANISMLVQEFNSYDHLPVLKRQIELAKDAPLSVALYNYSYLDDDQADMLPILIETAPRWQSLLLHCDSDVEFDDWFEDLKAQLASLKTLQLGLGPRDIDISLFADGLPSLTTVLYPSLERITSYPFPFAQITDFENVWRSRDGDFQNLQLMPNLQRLKLVFIEESNDPIPQFIFQHLTILQIDSSGSLTKLLSSITAPNLQVLEIRAPYIEDSLAGFVKRLHCPLTQLRIQTKGMVPNDLFLALKLVPTLESMTWAELDDYSDSAREALTYEDYAYASYHPSRRYPNSSFTATAMRLGRNEDVLPNLKVLNWFAWFDEVKIETFEAFREERPSITLVPAPPGEFVGLAVH